VAPTASNPAATTTTPAEAGSKARASGNGATRTHPATKTQARPKRVPAAKPKRKGAPKVASKPVHTVPIPAARAKVGSPRTWSGSGAKTLGTITLKRSSVVRWTVAGGGSFALADPTGALKIGGKGKTGQSFAAAGTYKAVSVDAKGGWTLSIAALGS
jgi:hypothetical protein